MRTAPSPRTGPRAGCTTHPHRHGHPRLRRPAGRSRAGSPQPPADQPAPQTRPAPHPAARSPVAVRPAAGHRPPPPLEDPDPGPDLPARLTRQAPITAPTTADLANLIGRTHTKKGK